MLTVQFSFQVFSSADEMFWRAITLRQNLATEAKAMVRTVFQMIHEVSEVRRREEQATGHAVSAKHIYDTYCSRATMNGTVGEDDFTQSFVDNALTINSRLFSNKARFCFGLRCRSEWLGPPPLEWCDPPCLSFGVA